MAGDWIKMRYDLHRRPQVVRMASALKTDTLRIVGGLHAVWCIADEVSSDGVLVGYDCKTIDRMIGFDGFAEAMKSVGWLDETPQGAVIPEFTTHNGSSAKRRAQDAERKKSVRKTSASKADTSRTKCGPEKRREEKRSIPVASATGASAIPPELDTAEFRQAWGDWLTYQGQRPKGKRQTPKGAEQALARWVREGWTPERVIAAIRVSIERNWQAVYEGNDRTGGLPFASAPAPAPSMPSPDSIIASLGKGGRA